MRPADIDITPGTQVRCRLPSGDSADAVVAAVRRFPVDFIEVRFARDGTKIAVPRSDIAQTIIPMESNTSTDDAPEQEG